MIHLRIILLVVLTTGLFSEGFSYARQHSINPRKLYLNQLLKKIESTTEQDESLAAVKAYVTETTELFDHIIQDFNAGALASNQEIEYKFVNMCNYLNSIEELEPRHIRKFSKQIQKFDDYVKKFCLKRKKYLTQADLDLFNRITKFNHRMTEELLKDEYLGIDGYDQCIDVLVYRPLEFVKEHKMVIALTLLVAAAAVGYFYVLPALKSEEQYKNNNGVRVQQMPCLTQVGANCPYHALYNYTCMRDAHGDMNRMQQMMNDRQAFTAFLNNCTNHLHPQGPIDAQDIERLINDHIVPGEHAQLIMVPDAAALNNIEVLDAVRTIDQPNGTEQGQITNARINFSNNQPQYFIVNTATAQGQENNTANFAGHWVTVGLLPQPAQNAPQVLVTDSVAGLISQNRDITQAPYVNQIHTIITR